MGEISHETMLAEWSLTIAEVIGERFGVDIAEDYLGVEVNPEYVSWRTIGDIHRTLVAALMVCSPGVVDGKVIWASLRDFLAKKYRVPIGQVVPEALMFEEPLALQCLYRPEDLPRHVLQAAFRRDEPKIQELQTRIQQLREETEAAVAEQDFDTAAHLRDQADKLKKKKEQITREWPQTIRREWLARYVINPVWLSWNDGTVSKLARTIFREHLWEDLPVLGGALEDAGCTDEEILGHCRQPGEHRRDCWVVDLLLQQE
jgi:hypothetical protein